MRLTAAIAALFAFALMTFGSHAAIAVIGKGLAHNCYLYADHNFGGYDGERACTAALNQETLSVRDMAATYVNRGVVRSNLRQYPAALADYNRAIGLQRDLLDSDLGAAYIDRGSVLNVLQRYDEALESVNAGLSLGTVRPEIAYYNRACAEEGLGNTTGAYLDYKQALALLPTFTAAAEQLKRFHVVIKPANGT